MEDNRYIPLPFDDYTQSANTLFHFMKEADFLNNILNSKAMKPRYCMENIEYLGIEVNQKKWEEIAVLQKCFCDIPFHKLTEYFELAGYGEEFDKLTEEEKYRSSKKNTHPDFYGSYAIAFSKSWGEKKKLQPVHYLNMESTFTEDFSKTFNTAIAEKDISDELVADLLNRLIYIKPLRGNMSRYFQKSQNEKVKIFYKKNFHDEKEWRYIPKMKVLENLGLDSIIANPNILRLQKVIEERNKQIETTKYEALWLKYEYDDIRYIVVPNLQARINTIKTILAISKDMFDNESTMLEQKYILISKILVLDEIRKDW